MDSTASFGYWLRRRRKALDLTQGELARQAGCATATIKKIEADERRPSRQLAERMADLLALAPDDRVAFLKAARAELASDQLDIATQPITTTATPASAALLPTGTVTFLFTDIEGSTRLWAQHPDGMRVALARHDTLLREAIEAHGGAVFKTIGDAFCAAFTTAADAVAAIVEAQRALAHESWETTGSLRVRAALHTGAAAQRDADYFGHTLSRVARLRDAGHGGQTLLSLATAELVRDHLPPNLELRDLGQHRLKDLTRPERIFQLVIPDLPADFPSLRALDPRRANLPVQPTDFIGREREVAEVCGLLRRDGVRLVTLTGPGGTGKTRLGIQVAAELLDEFSDGVAFVALAPISDPALAASAIAQALEVKESGGTPLIESLKAYLREKQLLLVLDNFEQIADAAPLVAELLAAATQLTVLVTSRERLHLSGEHEYAVPPLGLPPTTDDRRPTTGRWRPNLHTITQYEAVRLFIERAQAARADFAVTNDNAPAVAEICYRLDGLPLAIELAAARVKLFPPQALLTRLDNRLKLLTGGARDLPARQQTIRNTIDWSYNLLDAGEQTLFARLGVFVGGCTLEAAEAVCSDFGLPILDVGLNAEPEQIQHPKSAIQNILDGVVGLVDQSLLRQGEGAEGEPRFAMLETIREYALERLAASGEAEAIRRRHAEYFLALAEAAEPKLHGAEQRMWLDRLEQEHDNLRATLRWMIERREAELAMRLGAALGWFWWIRGYWREGAQWLEAALMQSSSHLTSARAWALFRAGVLALNLDDYGRGPVRMEEGLAQFRELGDKSSTAYALYCLGQVVLAHGDHERGAAMLAENVALRQELGDKAGLAEAIHSMKMLAELRGDYDALMPLAEELVALRRELGDPLWLALALTPLGETARLLGDDDRALAAYEEALALFRELGDRRGVAMILANMGFVVQRQGDHARAATLFDESLALYRELGSQEGIALGLAGLAGVAVAQFQLERAARLLGAVDCWFEMNNRQMDPTDRADYDRIVATTRAQLDDATFAAAWEAGRALTLEQAIEEALES